MSKYIYATISLWKNPPSTEDKPAYFDNITKAIAMDNFSRSGVAYNRTFSPMKAPQTPALHMKWRVQYEGSEAFQADEYRYAVVTYNKVSDSGSETIAETYFFWVESTRWIANKTLELNLKMDVLNTLSEILRNNSQLNFDDIFSERTMIHRMHKQRFHLGFSTDTDITLTAKIDETPEQLGTFTLLKKKDEVVKDKRFEDLDLPEATKEIFAKTPWITYYGKLNDDTSMWILFATTLQTNVKIRGKAEEEGSAEYVYLAYKGILNNDYSGINNVIELPYCPFATFVAYTPEYNILSLGRESTDHEFTGAWGLYNNNSVARQFVGNNASSDLFNMDAYGDGLPLIAFMTIPDAFTHITGHLMERTLSDSKLLHSDFHDLRFVYDSFSWSLNYEQLGYIKGTSTGLKIYFVANNAPVSRFGFLFEKYNAGYPTYGDGEAYDSDFQFMDCTRNNEVMVYTDDYLNYIRTGYNYDMKTRAITASASLASLATGTAMNLAVGGAVGATAGIASSLIGAIASFAQGNNSLDAKIAQLQARSVNTAGSDSLAMLKAYSGNKLHMMTYSVNSTIEKMLNDLFYYYGYRCEYQGKPNTTSRHFWNFIQCSPKFERNIVSRLPKFMLDEITRLCEFGITRFHYDGTTTSDKLHNGYDVDQKMENMEEIIWIKTPE